jgi:hypothetical protein
MRNFDTCENKSIEFCRPEFCIHCFRKIRDQMKQVQTQEIAPGDFVDFLKEKGVLSKDTKVEFVAGMTYCDQRDTSGTPIIKKIKLTKEVEVKDMLL